MDDAFEGVAAVIAGIFMAIAVAIIVIVCIVGYGVFEGLRFTFWPEVDYRPHLP